MKRKKFCVAALQQADLGTPVANLLRQKGISEQAFYRWKKQSLELEADQVREFEQWRKKMGG